MSKPKIKITWLKAVRRVIQLISFILMPGLFISTFSSIKAVYTASIGGTFSFAELLPQLLIILAVIPVTIILGRFFCGYICSFGSLGDLIWFISRKIRKKPIIIGEKADRIMKYFKYFVLVFIVIMVWTLGAVSFDSSVNPWNIFGMYTSLSGWSSLSGLITIGSLLLLLIMAGSFFIERFFCRYMCPLGAIFTIISKLRIFKVKKPTDGCRSCTLCTSRCSMGIDMYKHDKINSGECIDCFECIDACPRKNTQATIAGKDVAPLATGIVAAAAIMGLNYVGRIDITDAYAADTTAIVTTGETQGSYIDGTYTGSAQGYRGQTTVEVTVENGYITSIEVVSTGDDAEFFNRAESSVLSDILETQSTDVDTVTGATYSSNAIIDAVADALSISIDSGEESADTSSITEDTASADTAEDTQAAESSAASSTSETAVTESGSYEDGVYTGTGSGFRGDTEVSVTVSGGEITDIEIVSYEDDRQYFERAVSLLDDIISSQSVDVDTVSGATFSSNSILEAVADALGAEFTNTNSSISESGHGHGGH